MKFINFTDFSKKDHLVLLIFSVGFIFSILLICTLIFIFSISLLYFALSFFKFLKVKRKIMNLRPILVYKFNVINFLLNIALVLPPESSCFIFILIQFKLFSNFH